MKAIIEIDIPEYQIGQEVNIYFKDTMQIKGIVKEERPVLEELEKIKAEIDESSFETYEKYSEEPIVCNYTINVMQIIDKHISELKGEQNDIPR